MTYEQFKKEYSVEVLSFKAHSTNDPSVKNIFRVRVTQKKTQVFDDYTFDHYSNTAEPLEGYLNKYNDEIGHHIIHKSYELRNKHII